METDSRWRVSPASAAIPVDKRAELIKAAPWRTIWFSPRRTMRELMDSDERPSPLLAIIAVAGAYAVTAIDLDASAQAISFSRSIASMLVTAARIVLLFLVGPVILAAVGRWLGKKGQVPLLQQAVAWSYLPFVASVAIYMPVGLWAIGIQIFALARSAQLGTVAVTDSLIVLLGVLRAVDLTGKVWAVVLVVATIREVYQLSLWRSLASAAVFFGPQYLLTLAIRW